MDISTTRDQSVDTRPGGGVFSTSHFSGLGCRDFLSSFVFPSFQEAVAIFRQHVSNTARNSNHSCDPNCEAEITKRAIWLVALRDIQQGEELTYNYGYAFEKYGDFPYRCRSENC